MQAAPCCRGHCRSRGDTAQSRGPIAGLLTNFGWAISAGKGQPQRVALRRIETLVLRNTSIGTRWHPDVPFLVFLLSGGISRPLATRQRLHSGTDTSIARLLVVSCARCFHVMLSNSGWRRGSPTATAKSSSSGASGRQDGSAPEWWTCGSDVSMEHPCARCDYAADLISERRRRPAGEKCNG